MQPQSLVCYYIVITVLGSCNNPRKPTAMQSLQVIRAEKMFPGALGFLEVLGTAVAERYMGGHTQSRWIIRLFRNQSGGFCNRSFSSLLSAPARGTDHKGLSPAGYCEHPRGRRTSDRGHFAVDHVALLEEMSAFPPPQPSLSALGRWQLQNDPGGNNRETWGWFPVSTEPAGGNALCLCPTLSLQAVLPSLQNGRHGPGSLHIFPAGMAGWRPPKPHWFLPGRSVAAAGTEQLAGAGLALKHPKLQGEGIGWVLLNPSPGTRDPNGRGMLPSHPGDAPFLVLLSAGGLSAGRTNPSFSLQVYTAVYYVLADLVMLSLYCYYKAKNRGGGCELALRAQRGCAFPSVRLWGWLVLGCRAGEEAIPGGDKSGQRCFADALMWLRDAPCCSFFLS